MLNHVLNWVINYQTILIVMLVLDKVKTYPIIVYYLSERLKIQYSGLASLAHDINEFLSDDDVEIFLRIYALLYAETPSYYLNQPKNFKEL